MLAGIINTLLDAYIILKEEKFLKQAKQYFTAIYYHRVNDDEHRIALPGKHLFKISDDYATGSLGVLACLKRLENIMDGKEIQVDNFHFMLDAVGREALLARKGEYIDGNY